VRESVGVDGSLEDVLRSRGSGPQMKIGDQVRYTHALELDECLSLAVAVPDCSGTAKAVGSQPLATYNTINLVY
jgi:hypothetical protein